MTFLFLAPSGVPSPAVSPVVLAAAAAPPQGVQQLLEEFRGMQVFKRLKKTLKDFKIHDRVT